MPSTFTRSGIELPGDGEQSGTWGQTVNRNMQILDRLVSEAGSISLAGTTHTLVVADGSLSDGQYGVLVFGGGPSGTNTVTISPNDAKRTYIVKNTTAQTVVLRQGSGSTVSVPADAGAIVYCDGQGTGAAVVDVTSSFVPDLSRAGVTATPSELNILDGATVTTAELNRLNGLTATASELNVLDGIPATTGNSGKAVVVNAGGTGLSYVSFPEGTAYTAGAGLSLIDSQFSHADTSSQSSVNNSGLTFIQDVTLDGFGHVTGLVSATVTSTTPNDSTITISPGTGLTGGGSFTVNQSFNESISISATTLSTSLWQAGSSTTEAVVSPAKIRAAAQSAIPTRVLAQCAFNGTSSGTISVEANGLNVTNVTKNGTGDYTINFTSNLPHANYAVSGMSVDPGSDLNSVVQYHSSSARAVGSVRVTHVRRDGAFIDSALITITVVG